MRKFFWIMTLGLLSLASCTDLDPVEEKLDKLETRMTQIEDMVNKVNTNSVAVRRLLSSKTLITSYDRTADGYVLGLSDGSQVSVIFGTEDNCIVPVVGVDASGNWIMSTDGGKTFEAIKNAANIYTTEGVTPQIAVDAEGFWIYSTDGTNFTRILNASGSPISASDARAVAGSWSFFTYAGLNGEGTGMDFTLATGETLTVPVETGFGLKIEGWPGVTGIYLGETLAYIAELYGVQNCFFDVPEGWRARLTDEEVLFTAPEEGTEGDYEICLVCTSEKGLLKRQKFQFHFVPQARDNSACKPWNDWLQQNDDNLLLDFSYAGYDHGESAPPDVWSLGWKVYNVCDYGAVPNDGKSDRTAFLDCLKDAFKVDVSKTSSGIQFGENTNAKAIIYFPEGEFILHTEEDDNVDGTSNTILIRSGNWVLKGAGRDKTKLRTTAPGFPGEPNATDKPWSGIPLMTITCWNGPSDFATPVVIRENVSKGEFSVTVNSTAGITKDSWVAIMATIKDDEYIDRCLQPYGFTDLREADIYTIGVRYQDFHQVKSVEGNVITFYEPVMYDIDASRTFKVQNYRHYENVGIEDLSFVSCTPEDYLHHGSYLYDSGYIMVWTRRLVNSWIRRVDFDSVTEGFTFESCANCSAYDMECYGTRGHAMVRAASSSRVFIGATYDYSDGVVNDEKNPVYPSRSYLKGAGQIHGQGVNALCVGTVCWRNIWGLDACFEAHAQQPRASLFDCCKGGWMTYRVGGMYTSTPSHLDDLIIWNMNSQTAHPLFPWWFGGKLAWKVMPPTIIGFHGEPCEFEADQVKLDYSHGTAVGPESLYEAQVRRRLGYLPSWLNSIKTLYQTQ